VNPLALIPLIVWWAVSPGADYVRGMALARQGRWTEARAAFQAGAAKAPRDKRFPLELAGVAYRLGSRESARAYLRRALALDPADGYGNEFLGTIYFLDGNLEAALKYWNRARRPRIEAVRWEPEPRLKGELADRALVFAPSEILLLEDYRATQKRLDFLGIFSRSTIGLSARQDNTFDVIVRAPERRASWLSFVRGLPFETVYAELPDIRGSGVNLASMFRWDANKRRVQAGVAFPLARDPGWRLRMGFNARDENWSVPGAGDFRLRKAEASLDLAHATGTGTEWSAGFTASSRSVAVSRDGFALEARASLRRDLLRIPERRFVLSGVASGALGRMFEGDAALFGKSEAGIEAVWRALRARLRTGALAGGAPFDQVFMLGAGRDTELWLRGHPAVRNGKNGSGPLGREFALANIDWQPVLWRAGFFTLGAGPFLDAGRAWRGPAQSRWLADPGMQATARLAAGPAVSVSWSRRTIFISVSPLNW